MLNGHGNCGTCYARPATATRPGDRDTCKVEPATVVAADVYTAPGHLGRGGWTWCTGSAGWMYQFVLNSLLGVRVEVDTLYFRPLFRPDWNEYTVHYRYRNTYYHHCRLVREGGEQTPKARAGPRGRQLDEQHRPRPASAAFGR